MVFTLSTLNIFQYGSENFTKYKKERDIPTDFNRGFRLSYKKKQNVKLCGVL